jgi:hypothetical protein
VIEAQWTQRDSELTHERMEIRQMAVTFKQVGGVYSGSNSHDLSYLEMSFCKLSGLMTHHALICF